MDEDSLIRVLSYHNPHLMWVELKNHDTYTLRQVGLFGIVPRQAALVDGERVCTKSDRWDPRANNIVEEFLESKHQLCFKSIYRLDDDDDDAQTSIFPNHPHIFGEISSVRKQDGVKKLLSTCLDNSVYAYKSKVEFWQMLNEGKIETKLNEVEEIKVFENIIEYYKKKGIWQRKKDSFFKYISPSQAAKLNTEAPKLTIENLEKHQRLTSSVEKIIITKKPIQTKKYQDFSCELAPVEYVEDVIKKLTVIEKENVDKKMIKGKVSVVSKITVYDEEINPQGSGDDVDMKEPHRAIGRANSRSHKHNSETKTPNKLLKLKEKLRQTSLNSMEIEKTQNIHDVNIQKERKDNSDCSEKDRSSESLENLQNIPKGSEYVNRSTEFEASENLKEERGSFSKESISHKKPATKMSKEKRSHYFNELEEFEDANYNTRTSGLNRERFVAYGPPMNHKECLVPKLVTKNINTTDDSPTEPVVDTDFTINGGKINWEKENVKFDEDEEFFGVSKDGIVANSKFDTRGSVVNEVEIKVAKKGLKSYKGNDLNDSKNYNDFIQDKQRCKSRETNDPNFRVNYDNERSTQSNNDDKENIIPVPKQARNKLLEIMRKRKPKLNESLSSDDNSNKLNEFSTDSEEKLNRLNKSDSDDDLEAIHSKLQPKLETMKIKLKPKIETVKDVNTNPYKNLDGSKSVFVDNLVQPLLLAHTKNGNKVLPQSDLRDVPFKIEVHNTLRNMQVKQPNRLQSVSWPYILRGHSLFMISPPNSGKTLGYLPAVCNLVLDYNFDFKGLGPICIIVCATAISVLDVVNRCRMFVNHQRVIACFPGVDNTTLITDLVNGCEILVSTPSILYRLLGAEIGVDLRRLTTVVFEDCEYLFDVYELEVKAVQLYVKQMLKSRTDKQVRVQYVLASRKWCESMNTQARNAPDTIIVFTSFHECVLYSKTHTSVSFVKSNRKVDGVVEFLKEIDDSKLTVIVCRSDDEVDLISSTLTDLKISVVACNNQMNLHDLYKIRTEEMSPVLVCCDSNLKYLNVTYANYLVHFSMPAVYTQFCARFSVLNDNYPSIFETGTGEVKIKIFLEETNVEQLPKILNFVKRCSNNIPEVLNEVARKVLEQKDLEKAEMLVPICNTLLSLGDCAEIDICQNRHAILEAYDEPKPWMPCNGVITFKIIHYNSAISYSARLLTHMVGENKTKYPEKYGTLCMKLGMYFSKEENKRLHGEPKVGDVTAVAIRKNFIARCRVLLIESYEKGKAKYVVINLIDEEQIMLVGAVELLYLPEEFKSVETHVVNVRLANVRPQDKDVTFSELAMNCLKKITDEDDLYLKARVVMTVGNTIFVGTLEACAELSALCETVVKYDFKKMLLDTHAIPNPDHLTKLQKLCDAGNLKVKQPEVIKTKQRTVKKEIEHRWAHLDKDWTDVIFSNTINAGKFLVRPQKFDKCINSLIADIKKHVAENPKAVENVCVKDVVLAEFPDDSVYERAMVEEIIDDTKVKCFFVDNADWSEVAITKIKPIPQKFVKQIPFQSIECRLIGVKPPGEDWTEFSTNWLHDNCLEDEKGKSKRMYVKYFSKEKATLTGGHKYGVLLVDTTTENDLVINKRMIELNLAAADENEIEYLEKPLDFVREKTDTSSFEDDLDESQEDDKETQESNDKYDKGNWETDELNNETEDIKNNKIASYIPKANGAVEEVPRTSLKNLFNENPIRSFPLVSDSDEDPDKWDVCLDGDLGKCFGLPSLPQSHNNVVNQSVKQDNSTFFVNSKKENVITPKLAAITDINDIRNENEKDKPTDKERIDSATNVSVTDDVNESKNDLSKYTSEGSRIASKRFKLLEKRVKSTQNVAQQIDDPVTENKIQKNDQIAEENILSKESDDVEGIAENKPKNLDTKATDNKSQVIDISGLETSNTEVLRGEIKDVSWYDSDDTLSIITINDKIEIFMEPTTKLHKEKPMGLDSDDTESISTEQEKDLSNEKKRSTILDSDDSEDTDRPITKRLVEIDKDNKLKDIDVLSNKEVAKTEFNSKALLMTEVLKTQDNKLNSPIRKEAKVELKGKVIPITEIPKIERINVDQQKIVEKRTELVTEVNEIETVNVDKANESKFKTITVTQTAEVVRTPQLVWKQDKHIITIKIKVIVEDYTIETGNRTLKFSAYQNEIKYAFDIELYGVIESEKTTHANKGQYVLVTLTIMLKKATRWLKLTKEFKNWIVYDVDSIDTSSDEETPVNDDALKIIMDNHEKAMEVDNDDDFDDTSGYRYHDD